MPSGQRSRPAKRVPQTLRTVFASRPPGLLPVPVLRQGVGERRRGSGGFTLVEILLVLVILALGAAVAAPALWPALESVRAESAARRAASFLDEARRQSVLRRETLTVACDTEAGTLLVEGEGGAVFRVPDGAAIVSCEPPRLSYFPQGYASGGTVLLRDGAGREHRVSVGSFTGLSRVAASP